MTLPESYDKVFARFDENGGKFLPTWNWAAFIFGFFWYIYRGMWLKAIIYYLAGTILSGLTGGLTGFPLWIISGVIANYDIYLLKRKNTQLWEGGAIDASAIDSLSSASSRSTSKINALKNAKAQGVISEAEYAEKLSQIELDT